MAISQRVISESYSVPSGLAVNQHDSLGECIKKRLEPMIKEYYQDGNYVFWPDLASSYYASMIQNYMLDKNKGYVSKEVNPANVLKARPIEDFGRNLKTKFDLA